MVRGFPASQAQAQSEAQIALSIVVPAYNERENLPHLLEKIAHVMKTFSEPWEVVLVDDGSTDGSRAWLQEAVSRYPWLRVLFLKRNFGQTAAMAAGFDHARGNIIITMDADLQNDPEDIGRLLDAMREYRADVVSGWRKNRKDYWLRVQVSRVANWLIRQIARIPIHDLGCTLKAYRREVLQRLHLYGDAHRFLPVLAHWYGFRVVEVVVRHHPRRFGQSKYGLLSRTFRVALDLLFLRFLFARSPVRFFGTIGVVLMAVSAVLMGIVLYQKWGLGVWVHRNPLFLVGILFFLSGLQILLTGVLAEVVVRGYTATIKKPVYQVEMILESARESDRANSSAEKGTSIAK